MATAGDFLLDALRKAIGTNHVLCASDGMDLGAWEQDWRKRSQGKALAVLRPGSTQEVAQVVRICAAHQSATGVSIVAQGGNTGLVVGSVPDESGTQVVLSLQRMHAVRALDGANLTITVEAGCVLQTVQQHCLDAGYLFPLSLAAEGSCTIGGNLGTNAGGTQVVRYGNTRDLCLGLEVVNARGEIWQGLSGLRKDNTGYNLRNLFIGSEGTLGIMTAATMKLVPQPVAQLTAWAAVPSLDHALQLLALAQRQLSAGLTGFEVMGQFALSLVARHFPQQTIPLYQASPWCVLLENSDYGSEARARAGFEQLLESALEQGCISDAVVAENIAQAQQLWEIRERIPLAQSTQGLNVKHDISIPISRIPEFVRITDALLQQAVPGVRFVNFGHLGDGNLHYNVQCPEGEDGVAFLANHESAINDLVFDSVTRFDGSISAEHGIGSLKVDKLPQHQSAVALDMMRAVKRALDPTNLFNPGRVVRV
ncbi:MAG: FAD-binding oxidoreductase [Burkholderiaceae bacterium]